MESQMEYSFILHVIIWHLFFFFFDSIILYSTDISMRYSFICCIHSWFPGIWIETFLFLTFLFLTYKDIIDYMSFYIMDTSSISEANMLYQTWCKNRLPRNDKFEFMKWLITYACFESSVVLLSIIHNSIRYCVNDCSPAGSPIVTDWRCIVLVIMLMVSSPASSLTLMGGSCIVSVVV